MRSFGEWTLGKGAVEARIGVFERIRDIPDAVVPRINTTRD